MDIKRRILSPHIASRLLERLRPDDTQDYSKCGTKCRSINSHGKEFTELVQMKNRNCCNYPWKSLWMSTDYRTSQHSFQGNGYYCQGGERLA